MNASRHYSFLVSKLWYHTHHWPSRLRGRRPWRCRGTQKKQRTSSRALGVALLGACCKWRVSFISVGAENSEVVGDAFIYVAAGILADHRMLLLQKIMPSRSSGSVHRAYRFTKKMKDGKIFLQSGCNAWWEAEEVGHRLTPNNIFKNLSVFSDCHTATQFDSTFYHKHQKLRSFIVFLTVVRGIVSRAIKHGACHICMPAPFYLLTWPGAPPLFISLSKVAYSV